MGSVIRPPARKRKVSPLVELSEARCPGATRETGSKSPSGAVHSTSASSAKWLWKEIVHALGSLLPLSAQPNRFKAG